jgi:TusA-related sulfurtransferase
MRLRMLASSVLNFTGPLDSEAAPRLQRSLNHWQEGCVLHLLADDPKYADFIERWAAAHGWKSLLRDLHPDKKISIYIQKAASGPRQDKAEMVSDPATTRIPQLLTTLQDKGDPAIPDQGPEFPLRLADHSQAVAVAATTTAGAVAQPANEAPITGICRRCGATIDSSANANYTCPYCGYTQWGTLIGCGAFSLVLMVGAILWGSHISASFWRLLIMWGGGILGGISVLFAIAWISKGLRTPLKPLSEVILANKASTSPEPAVETGTPPSRVMQAAGAPLSQVVPEPDAPKPAPAGPKVVEAAVPGPSQENPIEKPVEMDRLSISNMCQKGDYGRLARMLYTLDMQSDRQYDSDKEAYGRTCDLIKEVGRQLDQKGGEELMKQVLVRAGSLGCNTRFIEREWSGIGSWWG